MKNLENYCYNKYRSCCACCGLYNLAMDEKELENWLFENTKAFLSLNLKNPEAIFQYRKKRELETEKFRVNKEVYVCPFLGYVEHKREGCLLHPKNSPHPQISYWEKPQNFSFYGASICQDYNCVAKERRLADIFPKVLPKEIYGRLVSRADILLYLKFIKNQNPNFSLTKWLTLNYPKLKELNSNSFENLPSPSKSLDPNEELEKLLANNRQETA